MARAAMVARLQAMDAETFTVFNALLPSDALLDEITRAELTAPPYGSRP